MADEAARRAFPGAFVQEKIKPQSKKTEPLAIGKVAAVMIKEVAVAENGKQQQHTGKGNQGLALADTAMHEKINGDEKQDIAGDGLAEEVFGKTMDRGEKQRQNRAESIRFPKKSVHFTKLIKTGMTWSADIFR